MKEMTLQENYYLEVNREERKLRYMAALLKIADFVKE